MKYLVFKDEVLVAAYGEEVEMLNEYVNTEKGPEYQYKEVEDDVLIPIQKSWRDAELKATDWIIPITDHPERDAALLYRVALRDWPSTDNFPLTKPII